MTTETTTNQLPPCPLPDCEGGEHHYHDLCTVNEKNDCARAARIGYRCYSQHRPGPIDLPEITDEIADAARTAWGLKSSWDSAEDRARRWRAVAAAVRDALLASIPQWQPIERDQIRAGMCIRATITYLDYVITRTGEAHHTNESGDWCTEFGWLLTGWAAPISYEVDPATIPADPDADLIEAVAATLYRTDWPSDAWDGDGLSAEAYRELARAALAAVRESEATA